MGATTTESGTTARTNGHLEPQENLLDTVIENGELEAALEDREKRNNSRKALTKEFKDAHEKVTGILAKLDLDPEATIRCGRFRITKSSVEGRSVAFETDPTSRLSIKPVGD